MGVKLAWPDGLASERTPPGHEPRTMRLFQRCHYRLVKGRDGGDRVAPPGGSSSSLLLGGWAMDHFLKPSAPLASREIVIIAIHLGELVWKNMGMICNHTRRSAVVLEQYSEDYF